MRKYISTERIHLFEPNILIHLFAEITGNPSESELFKAIHKALNANESTMSRVVLQEDGTAYYERVSETRNTVTVTDKEWPELIREQERIPLRIDEGELMRVFVISGGGKLRLLISAHHLAGDGKSVAYFLEDIMNALSGEELTHKPMVLLTDDTIPKECKLSGIVKAYARMLNRNWARTGRPFTLNEYYGLYEKYWANRSSVISTESFSADELNDLLKKAKMAGVSLNSLITAAILKANPDNKIVGLAVDTRSDGNHSISNQATGISVDIAYFQGKTLEDNARIFQKKAHKKLDDISKKYFVLKFMSLLSPTLIDSIFLYAHHCYENRTTAKIARAFGYKGGKTRELSITNLTRLDVPDYYGGYGIRNCVFVPPVISSARRLFGIVSIADGMTISYHHMNDYDLDEENAFFERSMSNLRALT